MSGGPESYREMAHAWAFGEGQSLVDVTRSLFPLRIF